MIDHIDDVNENPIQNVVDIGKADALKNFVQSTTFVKTRLTDLR